MSEFHWTNGWYFKRLENGSVRIRKATNFESQAPDLKPEIELVIPPNEWASIVASVSVGGDAQNFQRATELHSA